MIIMMNFLLPPPLAHFKKTLKLKIPKEHHSVSQGVSASSAYKGDPPLSLRKFLEKVIIRMYGSCSRVVISDLVNEKSLFPDVCHK